MRKRSGIERELATRADQRVLRWFGHVERMDEYHMARRALMAEVSGRNNFRAKIIRRKNFQSILLNNNTLIIINNTNEKNCCYFPIDIYFIFLTI